MQNYFCDEKGDGAMNSSAPRDGVMNSSAPDKETTRRRLAARRLSSPNVELVDAGEVASARSAAAGRSKQETAKNEIITC